MKTIVTREGYNVRGHSRAVLTPEQVIEIRSNYAVLSDKTYEGKRLFNETAARWAGVHPKTISDIVTNATWRHLKQPTQRQTTPSIIIPTQEKVKIIPEVVAETAAVEPDATTAMGTFYTETIDTDTFIKQFKTHPRQRDTERHARSAVKNHLAKPSIAQHSVAAAEFNGELYKVDGHTRAYLWENGSLPKPEQVHVTVYPCATQRDLIQIYETFDARSAAETSSDLLSGYLRSLGIDLKSQMLRSYKFGSALRVAYELRFGTTRGQSFYEALSFYRDELQAIDRINPNAKVFKIGILAGSFLVLKRRGLDMLPFFELLNVSGGSKADGQCDGVQALNEIILRSPSSNYVANRDLASRTISCAETWRAKRTYAVTANGVKVKATDARAYARRDA